MMKLIATFRKFAKTSEKRDVGPMKQSVVLGLSPSGNVRHYSAEDAGVTKQRRSRYRTGKITKLKYS
jgi:hypothetical protein